MSYAKKRYDYTRMEWVVQFYRPKVTMVNNSNGKAIASISEIKIYWKVV